MDIKQLRETANNLGVGELIQRNVNTLTYKELEEAIQYQVERTVDNPEIIEHLAEHLSLRDIEVIRQVSKTWNLASKITFEKQRAHECQYAWLLIKRDYIYEDNILGIAPTYKGIMTLFEHNVEETTNHIKRVYENVEDLEPNSQEYNDAYNDYVNEIESEINSYYLVRRIELGGYFQYNYFMFERDGVVENVDYKIYELRFEDHKFTIHQIDRERFRVMNTQLIEQHDNE